MTKIENEIVKILEDRFGDAIDRHSKFADQLSIFVKSDIVFDLACFLNDNETVPFEILADISGVDWIDCPENRFELMYNFLSLSKNLRLLVRTTIPDSETPSIRSIQPVYVGADWLEREVYDMLGIKFDGHPDLRRILTPDDFEGWPHRKDFPLTYEMPQFSHNKDNPPEVVL